MERWLFWGYFRHKRSEILKFLFLNIWWRYGAEPKFEHGIFLGSKFLTLDSSHVWNNTIWIFSILVKMAIPGHTKNVLEYLILPASVLTRLKIQKQLVQVTSIQMILRTYIQIQVMLKRNLPMLLIHSWIIHFWCMVSQWINSHLESRLSDTYRYRMDMSHIIWLI